MEAHAYIKFVRISPIKLRFIADHVKSLKPKEALDYLYLSNKRSAKVLYKAIKTALDSGKIKFNMQPEQTKFKRLMIDGGPVLKRFRAGGRGVAKPYKRKSSHITVIIEGITPAQKVTMPKKEIETQTQSTTRKKSLKVTKKK
ncbi:hypothetical protein A3H80_03330 [Candidatus Roizmanbacteria bacterium RIFCSPLOWO2_02_FULL_37_19]|uniref:50S ribosomal protein L22 n=1 Tax=Candidatus Roizmanbacteria bacterium RIFCSPHIGHO2_02_FULL_37_24 TaxID=1802037 RepID=A0A1F7GX51_9BACT|nr:MAG: hypothetical protein A2862_03055 [Candidatus Roizmanbacteria bacterium RIFCSPHIGHO2_01_FULL_38_41]OGK23062.1 MAG: hypothetical protein A3C24_00245 [Candidatus Roizmanbacteria bacterium RIFCSPHIGHO2_02_FULL_37_24]OGK33411.1 MAG: hypothetical protein A3E10_03055 [Candidatus Roizmanbacteria bacterium RIFCSPHIGHO2_12_FULL_37_23]OGK43475.1 MAG: hypothetical protein A2956_01990 [Candidatus Roizmanbacteria bacterium RIFCSPLOWO2_01_FULL_37_57]OGK54420.1 MAG: hypothetical protein A3H80_03330 [Ca